jgi:hypothetical protein
LISIPLLMYTATKSSSLAIAWWRQESQMATDGNFRWPCSYPDDRKGLLTT